MAKISSIAVVDMPDKRSHTFRTTKALMAAASEFGWTFKGLTAADNSSNEALVGLPKFAELAGPMLNGHTPSGGAKIRYETWEANRFYSE